MERLTSTRPWSDAQNDLSNEPGYGYIWQKLQRYEDTGLSPEEIERILDSYGRGMTLRTENAQRLEIIKEISTDRLRELAQAEKTGQLIGITEKMALAMIAGARAIEKNKRLQGVIYNYDIFGELGAPKEISYFEAAKVLREAAEAALKEMEAEYESNV